MKLEQKKTPDGMFFVVFVSTVELNYDYPTYVTIHVRNAKENPTISNILYALVEMSSRLEKVEAEDKNWQEVIDYGGEDAKIHRNG